MADYNISLGIILEPDDLSRIKTQIKGLESDPIDLKLNTGSIQKQISQIKTQIQGLDNVKVNLGSGIGVGSGSVKNAVNDINWAYKQMLDIQKKANSLSLKINGLDTSKNVNELKELSLQFARLRSDYETLKSAFGGQLSAAQFGNLQAEITETEAKLSAMNAKIVDTKAKLANKIEVKLEAGKFAAQVQKVNADAGKLSNISTNLRQSLTELNAAESSMNIAFKSGDVNQKIAAYKKYEATLESVKNQLEQNKIAEQQANNITALNQSRQNLSLKMSNWLRDNSAAAKQFGAEIRNLQTQLNRCNNSADLSNVSRAFDNIKLRAKEAGVTTKTLGHQIKDQFSKYASYFSVATAFMYVTQGLRNMFNTVLEIDTAMTGLYRVTDLTASQYDVLYDNMISSAKEYGATLTDIINATTDWVRAGFDADDALGLAEVTTMYQHISDLDYDTAAENLITAYNGFKDELNTAFDGDSVAAVEYIADIFNELDNNFAVTSAGLGEALTRSASALDLAGNSIQETAGMITGIVEVTQDPEKAGKMYARTYSNVWCNCKIA